MGEKQPSVESLPVPLHKRTSAIPSLVRRLAGELASRTARSALARADSYNEHRMLCTIWS